MIRLHVREGVSATAARRLTRFAEWLEGQVNVPHVLDVVLVPHSHLGLSELMGGWEKHDDGVTVLGLFLPPAYREANPCIFIAAKHKDAKATLAHEVMHYTQWRDGEELMEGLDEHPRNVEDEAQVLLHWYNTGVGR